MDVSDKHTARRTGRIRPAVPFPTLGRILRASRAACGLPEPRPPAWLTLAKGLVRGGTSVASWYRYEAGTHCPRAHVLIALADAYCPEVRDAVDADARREARVRYVARLCEALLIDLRTLANGACVQSLPLTPFRVSTTTCGLAPLLPSPSAKATKFSRLGAVLACQRAAMQVSVAAMRLRFPDWVDAAIQQLCRPGQDECLLPPTLWRFEVGQGVANGYVFALLPEVYGVSLAVLIDAIDADVARWLGNRALSPTGLAHGSSTL